MAGDEADESIRDERQRENQTGHVFLIECIEVRAVRAHYNLVGVIKYMAITPGLTIYTTV